MLSAIQCESLRDLLFIIREIKGVNIGRYYLGFGMHIRQVNSIVTTRNDNLTTDLYIRQTTFLRSCVYVGLLC